MGGGIILTIFYFYGILPVRLMYCEYYLYINIVYCIAQVGNILRGVSANLPCSHVNMCVGCHQPDRQTAYNISMFNVHHPSNTMSHTFT